MSADAGASALRTFADTMRLAAGDPVTGPRLALVEAAVLVGAHGADLPGVWLRFDEHGMAVGEPPGDAEPDVCLWMAPDVLERFPFVHLAMAMADGRVTFEGPVRELLAVMPVLRAAVENGRGSTGRGSPGATA